MKYRLTTVVVFVILLLTNSKWVGWFFLSVLALLTILDYLYNRSQ